MQTEIRQLNTSMSLNKINPSVSEFVDSTSEKTSPIPINNINMPKTILNDAFIPVASDHEFKPKGLEEKLKTTINNIPKYTLQNVDNDLLKDARSFISVLMYIMVDLGNKINKEVSRGVELELELCINRVKVQLALAEAKLQTADKVYEEHNQAAVCEIAAGVIQGISDLTQGLSVSYQSKADKFRGTSSSLDTANKQDKLLLRSLRSDNSVEINIAQNQVNNGDIAVVRTNHNKLIKEIQNHKNYNKAIGEIDQQGLFNKTSVDNYSRATKIDYLEQHIATREILQRMLSMESSAASATSAKFMYSKASMDPFSALMRATGQIYNASAEKDRAYGEARDANYQVSFNMMDKTNANQADNVRQTLSQIRDMLQSSSQAIIQASQAR
jgi:hypothetical protein